MGEPRTDAPQDGQQMLLHSVPWTTYRMMRETLSRGVRMTYRRGVLELVTHGRRHEMSKKLLARLVEMFCLERGIALYAYGNMTLDDERAEYAVEPDECYCRGEDRAMPDLAIEVVVTRGAIDKLELYHHMGVREVWLFEAGSLQILSRRDVGYEGVSVTAILPELDLARLVHYATQPDQNAALVEFVAELRAKS